MSKLDMDDPIIQRAMKKATALHQKLQPVIVEVLQIDELPDGAEYELVMNLMAMTLLYHNMKLMTLAEVSPEAIKGINTGAMELFKIACDKNDDIMGQIFRTMH